MHSLEIPVYFVSDTNLHLASSSLSDVNLRGIPLPLVTDDIDGNPRSSSAPTIGADESDLTSVNQTGSIISYGYSLHQNYPNPFNPITKIRIEIPVPGNVKLNVFNILGEEIEILLNKRLNEGSYDLEFDGTNYSGGVYFYKMTAENFVEIKRMILLK